MRTGASPATRETASESIAEGQRMMSICNACRYCEGYCAVFPAMARRLEFGSADMGYLANLCHNCGACYTSCQYAPPHEFALNLPRNLAQIRIETYRALAWPRWLAGLYGRGGQTAALLTAIFAAIFLGGVFATAGEVQAVHRSFYDVIPHRVMAWTFGLAAIAVTAILAGMFVRSWKNSGETMGALLNVRATLRASRDALAMTNLNGGGEGCAAGSGAPSLLRKWFHHLTSYGFLLCFAATVVGTFYHYALASPAPYALTSLPVLLGVTGGIGLLAGPIGLWSLARRRDPELTDPRQAGMTTSFIALLFATSATGLLLLALRATPIMSILLAIHLAVVMALFVSLPYGKFVHVIHRCAALLKSALERDRPGIKVAGD